MKSFAPFLIGLFSLCAFTAFASDAPTLKDTPSSELTAAATSMDSAQTAVEAKVETNVEALPETMTAPEPETPAAMMDEMIPAPPEEMTPALANVAEMVIATAIADREPVEPGILFTTNTERLYCHSRITSIAPTTITHIWYREGERVAEIPLQIGAASSWRTWSSKAIFPATPAAWRVEIVAENGVLLSQTDFTVE